MPPHAHMRRPPPASSVGEGVGDAARRGSVSVSAEGPDCAAGRSLAKMPVEQRDAVSCARKGRGVDSLAPRA